jgi:Tol biopolymer transport system component
MAHRDLKPGNIMLTRSGAKLLDFGLAKSFGILPSASLTATPTLAPTITPTVAPNRANPLTAQGAIVGTFQYMAPEQLDGKEADARSDIFAFGAVLYEMATGRRAFDGKTHASLIASILKEEPRPVAETAPGLPPALDRLIRTCLAKDPDDRRQSMRDVLNDLKWIAQGGAAVEAPPSRPAPSGRERLWMTLAALLFVISAALGWMALDSRPAAPEVVRLSFTNPVGENAFFGMAQLSPDGKSVAFLSETSNGGSELCLRALGSASVRHLPGTADAYAPFWSPDGSHLGFFADGKLKTIALAGGPSQTLCAAPEPGGGTWSQAGVIVFASGNEGLYRVPAGGGAPALVTHREPREEGHRWPAFLPDGRHFVFLGDASRTEDHFLRIASLDGPEVRNLIGAVSNAVVAPSGHLLYTRSGVLLAQRLDLKQLALQGDPMVIGDHVVVMGFGHRADFSVSTSGMLLYRSANLDSRLTWVDRTGATVGTIGETARFRDVALSRDGRTVLYEKLDEDGRVGAIWLGDLARGTSSRMTFHPGADFAPVWRADGEAFLYISARAGSPGIYQVSPSNPGEGALVGPASQDAVTTSCSPDGKTLLYSDTSPTTRSDIWALGLDGDSRPRPLIATPFVEDDARFSPDGRWIAYIANDSGRFEVYLQSFPAAARRIQVSAGGGLVPRWGPDGREIFFVSATNRLTRVELRPGAGGSLEPGATRELFEVRGQFHDIAPDGARFLIDLRDVRTDEVPYTAVLNWNAGLPAR